MTIETWPSTLPQDFLCSGFGDAAPDNLIIDGYNVGPPAYRRRTTAGPASYSGEMFMTTVEWETLSAFFHGALFDGVGRFRFPPQGTSDEASSWITRFISPPMRRASNGDDSWFVSLTLERLGIGEEILPSEFLETEGGSPLETEGGDVLETE